MSHPMSILSRVITAVDERIETPDEAETADPNLVGWDGPDGKLIIALEQTSL